MRGRRLVALAEAAPPLQRLMLPRQSLSRSGLLRLLAFAGQALAYVDLSNNVEINDAVVVSLATHCGQLRRYVGIGHGGGKGVGTANHAR